MKTVLIVDDDHFSRSVFARTLSKRGYFVRQSESAGDAERQLVEDAGVDLVVVDGVLPDGDSVELVTRIRQSGHRARVIYLASLFRDDSSAYRRLTDELDVSLVLHKPISPVEFSLQVDDVLDVLPVPPSDGSGEGLGGPDSEAMAAHETMRQRQTEAVESRLVELESALRSLRASSSSSSSSSEASGEGDGPRLADAAVASVERLAKQLRGTATRYGLFDVGEAAGRIEASLRALDGRGDSPAVIWGEILDALDSAFVASRQARFHEVDDLDETASRFTASLLLIEDDPEILRQVKELGRQNFVRVVGARSADEAMDRLRDPELDAIFIDVDQSLGLDAFELVRAIRERTHARPIPIAFLAAHGAIHDRVAAAHAGAVLFLEKPLDAAQFSDAVHYLVSLRRAEQPTVLIVDDDDGFVRRTSEILRAAGMQAHQLTDTTRVIEELERLDPDGVLLNVTMPRIGGFDVCRMLRAIPRWHDLPILFVADQMSASTRIAAFRAGGDDYLVKPVVREEMLARLRVRIDRLRLVKERADRDVLTGLLTRRAFLQRVAARMAEVRRRDQPLSLGLIDLDHFKEINDVYGHIAGDRVLSAFGKLLANRFRMEDLRGRWGGEEFVVALVEEDAQTAQKVLQRILGEFSSMRFEGDHGRTFHVTFSGGVAEFDTDGDEFEGLLRAADRRLYEAKEAGRSRIVT